MLITPIQQALAKLDGRCSVQRCYTRQWIILVSASQRGYFKREGKSF
jgi:hypothetical protein